MSRITIGIVFGGKSPEHKESIRAARYLYEYAIEPELERKYRFKYFYITKENRWASAKDSKRMILKELPQDDPTYNRIADLAEVSALYSLCMGSCGENGNIMGIADLLNVPMIGCGILASALALDKQLSKIVVKNIGIPTVESIYVDRHDDPSEIGERIWYPCFVKPTNLGTCAFVFRADSRKEFREKWDEAVRDNKYSKKYLIERFVPNMEIRVFIHEDSNGRLHMNDEYATTLIEKALVKGGGLFDHHKNRFSNEIRKKIKEYAKKVYKTFGMKDYARIDFFVENGTNKIYFNETNTQPFISTYNVELMENDGISYAEFLETMIERNVRN